MATLSMVEPEREAAADTADALQTATTSVALELPRLADPPPDWTILTNVIVDGSTVPCVVVGPNGVFTIEIDPDPTLCALRPDGIWRHGQRVPEPVKRALRSAFDLRRALARAGIDVFPYPMLAAAGAEGRLGRLQVLPPERLAEAVWGHPGLPLARSQRRRAVAAISHPSSA